MPIEKNQIKKLSERLKEIRAERGVTQRALARKANVAYVTLVKIENDMILAPSYLTVLKIVRAMEISLDEFFEGVMQDENEVNHIL